MALTAKQLAKAAGCSDRTIRDYVARGMPASSAKKALDWIEKNINQQIGQPTIAERAAGKTRSRDVSELEIDELQAKIRKLAAESEAKELKNAQLRGELYEASEVERQVAELTSRIRLRLESIPIELQTEWPTELQDTVTQRMRDKIILILTEMSHWRLDVPANVSTGDSELPAASADSDDSMELAERSDA